MRLLALTCVLLLAVTSTVELAHAHRVALTPTGSAVHSADLAALPDSGCTICLAAHSPAIAIAVAQMAPSIRSESSPFAVHTASRSPLSIFVLYVRPPPLP